MAFIRIPAKRSKYGNVRTVCKQGHKHRSKWEANVCRRLHENMAGNYLGWIEIVEEVPIYLSKAKIKYIVDFRITLKNGNHIFFEAKGKETAEFRIHKKLWKFYGPGPLHIWKMNATFFEALQDVIEVLPVSP